jgi:hypothetical protein
LDRNGRMPAHFDLAELNLSGFSALNHEFTIENGALWVNKG